MAMTIGFFKITIVMFCCVINNTNIASANCSSTPVHLARFAQKNKTLNGYTYRQVSHILNVHLCAEQCLLHRMCRSINYNRDLDLCDLNSEDHLSKPQSLSLSVTSHYYIIDGWPEFFLGGCQNHTCSETHVCVVLFQGLSPTYTCIKYDLTSTTPVAYTIGCTNVFPAITEVVVNSVTVRFSPMACVYSPGITLTTFLHSYRDSTLDWFNFRPVIEGCAGLAHTSSFKYFGIEFFGECWADTAFVEASHTKIPADECHAKTYLQAGIANVICVYEIL
ncbi:uncharacterized protein LOC117344463 [Pecten maximus]|uniref:uncharacterized protein LOC117344463 n=1 Tax=Pecten maximus TaxID=6579 RepID=UPI001458D01F|nr:uncharacterized protein LOC117344463 [Pecten maximus]